MSIFEFLEKRGIRALTKKCLAFLVVVFTLCIILLTVVPAGYWGFQVITGKVSFGSSFSFTIEDILSYSVSILTLLVTVMTVGIGLVALIGYTSIRETAEKKAEEVTTEKLDAIATEKVSSILQRELSSLNKEIEKMKQQLARSGDENRNLQELIRQNVTGINDEQNIMKEFRLRVEELSKPMEPW